MQKIEVGGAKRIDVRLEYNAKKYFKMRAILILLQELSEKCDIVLPDEKRSVVRVVKGAPLFTKEELNGRR